MPINRIGSDPIRPSGTKPSPHGKRASEADGRSDQPRSDRVEISEAGRDLAAKRLENSGEMTESRRAMIQERIARGFYNDGSIAESVAERLIESGEFFTRQDDPPATE